MSAAKSEPEALPALPDDRDAIYIVIYSHRHGVDAWARWTREDALASIATIMDEYEEDLEPEHWGIVSKCLKADDCEGAIMAYEEHHPRHESFDIRESSILKRSA